MRAASRSTYSCPAPGERMRAVISLLLLAGGIGFLTGESVAQDKKEPKKVPLTEPYTEYVTVKWYLGKKDAEFVRPQESVHAYRIADKGGKQRFVLRAGTAPGCVAGGAPPVKSEIIDTDGATWVLVKRVGSGSGFYNYEVEKKPVK